MLPRICSLFLGFCAGIVAIPYIGNAHASECKPKTAGFFLQERNAGPTKLSAISLSLPPSLTGAGGNPERGRQIFVDRQKGDCLSCHKLSALSPIEDQGSIGPTLDGIGSRYGESQLRQIVMDPKAFFPDTIMPSYYTAGGSADALVLTAPEVEDLVAYMKTLK